MKNNKEQDLQEINRPATDSEVNQSTQSVKFDWLAAGLFVFSIAAASILSLVSLISLVVVISGGVLDGIVATENQLVSSLLFSAGLGFIGLLSLPAIYHAGRRVFGYPPTKLSNYLKPGWLLVTLPILIYLGYLAQTGPSWGKYILFVFHILANTAGVLFFLSLAVRNISRESAIRNWGSFTSGLTLAPLIAFGVEVFFLILLGAIWLMILQDQPELKQDLLNLSDRMQQSSLSQDMIDQVFSKLLVQPGVLSSGFIYIAVLVPLVEELIKPAVVWLTLGRKPSPRTGFLTGAAAGAGYALFENLTIGADVEVWTFITITRLGTSAVHILTTAIVGWGIASAWTEKKYIRLAGSLLSSVIFHGVWNGLNVFNALVDYTALQEHMGNFVITFGSYAPAGLVVLALGAVVGIIRANSFFQRAIIPQINGDK